MTKKKGIITLLIMLAVLLGGIYASIYGIDNSGAGSASKIKQGLDLAGGVSITYQVVGEEEKGYIALTMFHCYNNEQMFEIVCGARNF